VVEIVAQHRRDFRSITRITPLSEAHPESTHSMFGRRQLENKPAGQISADGGGANLACSLPVVLAPPHTAATFQEPPVSRVRQAPRELCIIILSTLLYIDGRWGDAGS
jgi:hypothetical protein